MNERLSIIDFVPVKAMLSPRKAAMLVRASSAHEAAWSGTIHLDRNGLILREVDHVKHGCIVAYWQGSLLRLRLSPSGITSSHGSS